MGAYSVTMRITTVAALVMATLLAISVRQASGLSDASEIVMEAEAAAKEHSDTPDSVVLVSSMDADDPDKVEADRHNTFGNSDGYLVGANDGVPWDKAADAPVLPKRVNWKPEEQPFTSVLQ